MSSFPVLPSVANRIVNGVKWTAVGFVVSKLFALLSAAYLSRFLGKESYGELGIIQSTIGLFGVFAGAGLGLAATKFIASFKGGNKDRVSKILGLVCISACAFTAATFLFIFLMSGYIATDWLNNESLSVALRISCMLLATNVAFEMFSSILAGFEDFKSCSIAEVVRGIMALPAAFFFTPDFRVSGAIIAFTLASIGGSVFLALKVRRILIENGYRVAIANCTDELHILTKFSLPALISSLLFFWATWFSTVLLAHTPKGYEELGIYNAAGQLRLVIMMIPILLSRVMVPFLAKEYGEDNSGGFVRAIEGANFAIIMLIIPASLFLFCTGEYVMSIFGKDYSSGWRVLIFIVAGTSVSAIGSVIGSVVVATGNMWAGALQNLIWSLTYIVAVYFQYKWAGALALANSFLLAHFVLLLITVIFLLRRSLLRKELVRNIIASVSIVLVTAISLVFVPSGIRLLVAVPLPILFFLGGLKWLMPKEVETFLKNKGGRLNKLILRGKII